MCSVCRPAAVPLALALIAGVAAGACRERTGPAAAPEAHAFAGTAVGPLPGPAEYDGGPENPFAGDRDAFAEGRRFFVQYNCAGCHGDHGGGGMGPSLRDEAWLYGSSPAQIAASIRQGRAHGMPAWGAMLTPTQVWQLTAYITSLRTPHEASPPR